MSLRMVMATLCLSVAACGGSGDTAVVASSSTSTSTTSTTTLPTPAGDHWVQQAFFDRCPPSASDVAPGLDEFSTVHEAVVVTTGEDDAWLAGSGEAGDRGWIDHPGQNDVMVPDRWLAAEVGATELVVCIRYVATESIAQRCSYTGGQEVIYQRRDVEVTVYDASTAQVVGQKKLWGPSTVDCPTVETFYGGGDSKTRYLDWPTTAEVKAVLASFIEG